MSIHFFIILSNPFFDAYFHTDFLGKLIFISLIACSLVSWIILIYKVRLKNKVKILSLDFHRAFRSQQQHPLNVHYVNSLQKEFPNPFFQLYQVLRKQTLELLHKNSSFGKEKQASQQEVPSFLSPADIDAIESHLSSAIASQTTGLEKNLFILSTIVTLAPFLGLLGTVWGILATFSELQAHGAGNTNQMVLGGLSLALATTVMGLINAIPALVAYNYLKNGFRDFQVEMESFSTEILAVVELHYRSVDIH